MDKKTIFIITPIIVAMLCVIFYAFHTITILSSELNSEKKLNEELTQTNNSQKETIAALQKSIADNNKSEKKTDYSSVAKRAEDVLKIMRERKEKEKDADQNSIENNYYSFHSSDKNNTVTCAIPNCNHEPERNSFFCYWHECSEIGCHNRRANDLCFYCIEHKCIIPDCNSGKAYNSYTCYRHKN